MRVKIGCLWIWNGTDTVDLTHWSCYFRINVWLTEVSLLLTSWLKRQLWMAEWQFVCIQVDVFIKVAQLCKLIWYLHISLSCFIWASRVCVLIRHLAEHVWVGSRSLCEMEREGHKRSVCVTVMTAKPDYYHMVLKNAGVDRQTAQSFAIWPTQTDSKLRRSVKKGKWRKGKMNRRKWVGAKERRCIMMKLVSWWD